MIPSIVSFSIARAGISHRAFGNGGVGLGLLEHPAEGQSMRLWPRLICYLNFSLNDLRSRTTQNTERAGVVFP